MLKFGHILPNSNWDMAQNVICKGHDLGKVNVMDQNKLHHQINWPKNMDLDAKVMVISALVQQLWSKASFCIMVANVMHLCMSHIQTAQDIFNLLKGPDPNYCVLKFGNILLIYNWVVAHNVILQRSLVKTNGGWSEYASHW